MKYSVRYCLFTLLVWFTCSVYAGGITDKALLDLIKKSSGIGNKDLLIQYFKQNPTSVNKLIKETKKNQITPLIAVVLYSDNLELVKLLVKLNADVNYALPDGRTALSVALNKSSGEIAKYLYHSGACAVNIIFNRMEIRNQLLKKIINQKIYNESLLTALEQDIKKSMTEAAINEWDKELQELKQNEAGKKDQEECKEQAGRHKFQMQSVDDNLKKRLLILEKQLNGLNYEEHLKAENDSKTEALFLRIRQETLSRWESINKTKFMSMLFPKKRDTTAVIYWEKVSMQYFTMLFFIYDMLHTLSIKNNQLQIKQLIEKTKIKEHLVKAYAAVAQEEEKDIDTFKKQRVADHLTCSPKLREYLESHYEIIKRSVLPKELEILAHLYVWLGGQFGDSCSIASVLQKKSISNAAVNHLQLCGNGHYTSVLTLDLISLIGDVAIYYPSAKDDFIHLIKEVYMKKTELLDEVTHPIPKRIR
ncbi:MAG: ankyrin repeat domain-containing protein [Endozoicomonadaceae bacterium]|nr:ankyrin repeat domain-containing protein [Endozoicomonadaceae bacterium]MCY4329079.1 ankyrin repeat domain-containing protein [Endozoicomonadaceae bacterium]